MQISMYIISAMSAIWGCILGKTICSSINDNRKKQKIICNIFIALIAIFILSIEFIL